MSCALQHLAEARRQGAPAGIYSVCSAHPWVIEAAIDQALADDSDLLIESTSNQVNHLGGYTCMLPEDFRRRVNDIAAGKGFDKSRLILGGDHLGPNPWHRQPALVAMQEAVRTVEAYARGFRRSTSMPAWLVPVTTLRLAARPSPAAPRSSAPPRSGRLASTSQSM